MTAGRRPRLTSIVALGAHDDGGLLALAASLATSLNTAAAAAIVESAQEREIELRQAEHFHVTSPLGVAAAVDGHSVVLGNAALFKELGVSVDSLGDWPERLQSRGEQVLFVAIDRRTAGFLSVADHAASPAMEGSMEAEMRGAAVGSDQFPTQTADLPASQSVESIELADGGSFQLRIAPVTKRLGDATVRMLAYNGSVPGPTLRVQQGSEVLVTVVNEGDLEATVHWHGLRLDNRYDGTLATQCPIPVGGTFTYRLTFPDPGIYWYHPHIREDYGQEMGLYGNIVVVPSERDYWPSVHREHTLALDDILVEEGRVAPFSPLHPTFTAMGRFGNTLLVNGEPHLSLRARNGEVVRFYLTNTANARVFNVGFSGARMKLVGGDSGRCERETFVESVVIAPSERVVVDVLFDRPGNVTLEHRTPDRTYLLAAITVDRESAVPSLMADFDRLRTNADMTSARALVAQYLSSEPDKTLALVAEMDMGEPDLPDGAIAEYLCPMHADVISNEPGRCPKCGMKLLAKAPARLMYVCPMHPAITSAQPDRCPTCGMKLVPSQLVRPRAHASHDAGAEESDGHQAESRSEHVHQPAGIEWEDDMVDVNRMTSSTNMWWKLIDRDTGAEGEAIDWRFSVGQHVKIRVVNEMDSDHPMQHPFHIHGAGRFLILSRDGAVESNLVWKDTVLVRTGETVDILLAVTHPGVWMAHCHIAEHHESGMMLRFRVDQ
jgi:FtsP/CotA-like multicopper oxidase with cupredoxin domain